MSGVAGKPRQTRLHVLLLAAKSHKKRLGCGHIVDTLTTISTFQRVISMLEHALAACALQFETVKDCQDKEEGTQPAQVVNLRRPAA